MNVAWTNLNFRLPLKLQFACAWMQTTARLCANGKILFARVLCGSTHILPTTHSRTVDTICGRSARTITQTVPCIECAVDTQAHTRTCKFVKKMRNNFENKKTVSLRLPLHCVRVVESLGNKTELSSSHQVHWIHEQKSKWIWTRKKVNRSSQSCEHCTWLTRRIIILLFFFARTEAITLDIVSNYGILDFKNLIQLQSMERKMVIQVESTKANEE